MGRARLLVLVDERLCVALLLSHRISFTKTGIPVFDDHALLPVDGIVITATRSPERLTLAG